MSFIRLHVTVEGPTEEQFVKQILAPHLWEFNIIVDVQCIVTSRDKKKRKTFRGGLSKYEKVRKEIYIWMKRDRNNECRFSTMFDLYALPTTFPGFDKAKQFTDPYQRVKDLEESFREDIGDIRFIPYIQLHEFEALILADPSKLQETYINREKQIQKLCRMVEKEGGNPELINVW